MRRGLAQHWSWVVVAAVLSGCAAGEGVPSSKTSPHASASPMASAESTGAPTAGVAGGLVSIGERSLWLECRGEGAPTVILESGMGGDHRTWERVQQELGASVRVCAYDRAGIAESDPAASSRTAADAVDDLHDLLETAGIEPPYVLVGFSFGGLISQLYASSYPAEMAGLVLVESSHPREWDEFKVHLTEEQIAADRQFSLDNPEGMDPYRSFGELQAAGPLPDVPLVVVTAAINDEWPPGWDPETFDTLRAAQQADLATFTPQGRQVVAEGSGHNVPSSRPDVIVDAVESMLGKIEG
jgi:pimeloyl-ACP methyl ester carboxylesterase